MFLRTFFRFLKHTLVDLPFKQNNKTVYVLKRLHRSKRGIVKWTLQLSVLQQVTGAILGFYKKGVQNTHGTCLFIGNDGNCKGVGINCVFLSNTAM